LATATRSPRRWPPPPTPLLPPLPPALAMVAAGLVSKGGRGPPAAVTAELGRRGGGPRQVEVAPNERPSGQRTSGACGGGGAWWPGVVVAAASRASRARSRPRLRHDARGSRRRPDLACRPLAHDGGSSSTCGRRGSRMLERRLQARGWSPAFRLRGQR
jgi:hypothetical protein